MPTACRKRRRAASRSTSATPTRRCRTVRCSASSTCPGHEKLIHNMLAGATGIDFVLLVIAADDGPMPQTREHLELLGLLGLDRGAVALTKCDVGRCGTAGERTGGRGTAGRHTAGGQPRVRAVGRHRRRRRGAARASRRHRCNAHPRTHRASETRPLPPRHRPLLHALRHRHGGHRHGLLRKSRRRRHGDHRARRKWCTWRTQGAGQEPARAGPSGQRRTGRRSLRAGADRGFRKVRHRARHVAGRSCRGAAAASLPGRIAGAADTGRAEALDAGACASRRRRHHRPRRAARLQRDRTGRKRTGGNSARPRNPRRARRPLRAARRIGPAQHRRRPRARLLPALAPQAQPGAAGPARRAARRRSGGSLRLLAEQSAAGIDLDRFAANWNLADDRATALWQSPACAWCAAARNRAALPSRPGRR
jgi:hypothetical protein